MSRLVRFTIVAWGAFIGAVVAGTTFVGAVPTLPGRVFDALAGITVVAAGAALVAIAALTATRPAAARSAVVSRLDDMPAAAGRSAA